jgi:hypothetical protein
MKGKVSDVSEVRRWQRSEVSKRLGFKVSTFQGFKVSEFQSLTNATFLLAFQSETFSAPPLHFPFPHYSLFDFGVANVPLGPGRDTRMGCRWKGKANDECDDLGLRTTTVHVPGGTVSEVSEVSDVSEVSEVRRWQEQGFTRGSLLWGSNVLG